MTGELDGYVAIVTGGSRGIGQGVARSFLERGAKVSIAARSPAELIDSAKLLSDHGDVAAFPTDVTAKKEVEDLVAKTVETFGRLDILACCHGVYDHTLPFLDFSEEEFDRTVAINLKGSFLCAQASARAMVACKARGRIILISSIDALAAEPECPGYTSSKAAIHGLVRSIAIDLAAYGITANAIAPGWVATPMTRDYLDPKVFNQEARFSPAPTGRIGLPSDIGLAASWLAHPLNSFTTGSVVVVDGGQTAQLVMPEPAT